MPCAISVLLLAAAVSVDASRDESSKATATDVVHVSVKPTNFDMSNTDRLEMDVQPEEERVTANLSQRSGLDLTDGSISEEDNQATALELVKITDSIQHVSEKAASIDAWTPRAKAAKAKAGLRLLAEDSRILKHMADVLEQKIQAKYMHLLEDQVYHTSLGLDMHQDEAKKEEEKKEEDHKKAVAVRALRAIQQIEADEAHDKALDSRLDKLGGKVESLLQMFDEIKHLKHAKDQMRARQAHVVKAAENAGLTQSEMEEALEEADAKENSFVVDSETDSQTPTTVHQHANHDKSAEKAAETAPHAHPYAGLPNVQTMLAAQTASKDFSNGMAEFRQWRAHDDGSEASARKGEEIQAKLAKAIKSMDTAVPDR